MMQFAASTHPGLKRSHNEDCYQAAPEQGLWLVADGVGGHSFGEVASAIVKSSVTNAHSVDGELLAAVKQAHQDVLTEIAQRDENLGMGSTVVAFALKDQDYDIIWVGDSRAYLWDGEDLTQLTRDHSHVYDLVDQGIISPAEATNHPERHVLTQSIGVFDDMELKPGHSQGRLEEGQQILLCSDGLTDELSDIAIAGQMRSNSSTQSQVDGLINTALACGGRDNITVVVIGEASSTDHYEKMAVGQDLEMTQDISHAIKPTPKEKNFRPHFWIALVVFIAAVLALT